jgi:hypothetical protein
LRHDSWLVPISRFYLGQGASSPIARLGFWALHAFVLFGALALHYDGGKFRSLEIVL